MASLRRAKDAAPPCPRRSSTLRSTHAYSSCSRSSSIRYGVTYLVLSAAAAVAAAASSAVAVFTSSSAAAAVVVAAAATMSLIPKTHAAYVCPASAARERQRQSRMMHPFLPSSPSSSSMPFLMATVACRDGFVEVERTYKPTKPAGNKTTTKKNKDDDEDEQEVTEKYSIFTRIFRPMSLSSMKAAPILALHGGPSVPSDYLYPLVDHVPYRSVVFYHQVGCGRSSIPTDANSYSISYAVDDLEVVIKKLGLRRFHLYGQSFGGILAFEYLKRVAERGDNNDDDDDNDDNIDCPTCLSVVISSTPTSVPLVEASASRLLDVLRNDDDDESTLGERFRTRHQCRMERMPIPLLDAYAHAGTVWRGTQAIPNYTASPPGTGSEEKGVRAGEGGSALTTTTTKRMPSAMILRGQHDFVDDECVAGWASKEKEGEGRLFNHNFVRMKVLDECSHHGLLENGRLYGETLESFFAEYD